MSPKAAFIHLLKKELELYIMQMAQWQRLKLKPGKKYFKLTLQSLANRVEIDDIQWGLFHTKYH